MKEAKNGLLGPATNWQDARRFPQLQTVGTSEINIFAGSWRLETACFGGVEVGRLSVCPMGESKPPTSFAVDFAPNWKNGSQAHIPVELKWRQLSNSAWKIVFHLPEGVQCLGLGERMSGLNLRGRIHTLFTTDDMRHIESIDSMYKAIPFLILNDNGKCSGIFLDSPAMQRWSLDPELSQEASIELLSRRGWQLYVFGPASLSQVVGAYTQLTGRAKLPPLWSLGHQQSRWSYPDEKTVREIAYEFRQRKIPCDTIVLDIDYMDEYRVFTHCPKRFPNLKQLVQDLAADNFSVVTIVDPGVKKDANFGVFEEGKAQGHFCTKASGELFFDKVWPGISAFPDFLREETRKWWADAHHFYVNKGVAGIWNDMNEPALFDNQTPLDSQASELPPESQQLFLQSSPDGKVGHFEVRNVYGMQMSRATHEALSSLRPGERPFVLTRAAYAGTQRYAAVWLGDNMSWWEHLSKSIPMLLNMGLSGVAFGGVDVGGFGGDCSAELLARWYAVGMFYPFFRNHCAMRGRPQEPWAFSKEVEDCCRKFIEIRYRLLPYVRNLFWEHMRTGAPLMRPLSWHYPLESMAVEIDDEFMFGADILVAPILKRGSKHRKVYLPQGIWHPFDGGEPLVGGQIHVVKFGLADVPAFVRDGAILPLSDVVQSTKDLPCAPTSFVCYGNQAEGIFFQDDGKSLDYEHGAYNEWKLTYKDQKLKVSSIHFGYDAPAQEYWFVKGDSRSKFEMISNA